MRDISPVIFRGEDNYDQLREAGGWTRPWYFAEDFGQAKLYASGRDPVAYVLQGEQVLDLTQPDPHDPRHKAVVEELTAEFDDWTCRYSGEPRDAWSYLECGDLYDYEGTGSGDRWKTLFRIALDQCDAVRVLDCTDGTNHQRVPVWVTSERKVIRLATLGEELAARVAQQPWEAVRRWLERKQPSVLERINRLRSLDDEFRLDRVHQVVPAENFKKMGVTGASQSIYRGMPEKFEVLPGDWVALRGEYAKMHVRLNHADGPFEVKSLTMVHPSDVYWAGTDESEFFYAPAAWRRPSDSAEQYLKALSADRLRMLCDGEMSSIRQHQEAIAAIQEHVQANYDHEACGTFHGPDHWDRVSKHSLAVSRYLGIDPLVPYIFALVHDSQRQDDGVDPDHGPRAGAFVLEHRGDLFGFLSEGDIETLAKACELHSNGQTEGDALVKACWDADRLDLGRVGVRPEPGRLCTEYAKREDVIEAAVAMSGLSGDHDELHGGSPAQAPAVRP